MAAEQATSVIQTRLWWGRICRERGDEQAAILHFAEAIAALEQTGHGFALAEARRIAAGPSGRAMLPG